MRISLFLASAALLSTGVAARADTFAFSFGTSSSSFSGSGTLTTGVLEAPGEYLIASVTGTAETTPNGPPLNITGILAPGSFPTPINGGTFPANDNTLFVTNGIGSFSQDGLSFILADGAQINLYNDGSGNDAFLKPAVGTNVLEDVPVIITAVATTPEPSSFALLGTGLLGFVGAMRRRSR